MKLTAKIDVNAIMDEVERELGLTGDIDTVDQEIDEVTQIIASCGKPHAKEEVEAEEDKESYGPFSHGRNPIKRKRHELDEDAKCKGSGIEAEIDEMKAMLEDDMDIQATEVAVLPSKVQNQIEEIKKVRQQVMAIQKQIQQQVGDLQAEASALTKIAENLEKDLMPILKDLDDHAITAEGIFVELKKGRRSPKIGYDYLAAKVATALKVEAEKAMMEAAKFAQKPSVSVAASLSNKRAGVLDWLKNKMKALVGWIRGFGKRVNDIGNDIKELDKLAPRS